MAAVAALLATGAVAQGYPLAGDSIPTSLTGEPGDPRRGRAVVANRTLGLCLLCHSGPIPEERFQGNLAPNLAGAGTRFTEGQLRLRIVDGSRINPDTIMPAYYRAGDPPRVARAHAGRTILTAAQVEDVVAYLATLKD